jgi:vacuolar-type H+-ATPase subunit I/STV1
MNKQDDKIAEKLEEISEKLDTLSVLFAGKEKIDKLLEKKNQTEQIQILRKWKLSNEIIAMIIGTTPDVVSVRASEMKTSKKPKKMKSVKENEQGTERNSKET